MINDILALILGSAIANIFSIATLLWWDGRKERKKKKRFLGLFGSIIYGNRTITYANSIILKEELNSFKKQELNYNIPLKDMETIPTYYILELFQGKKFDTLFKLITELNIGITLFNKRIGTREEILTNIDDSKHVDKIAKLDKSLIYTNEQLDERISDIIKALGLNDIDIKYLDNQIRS